MSTPRQHGKWSDPRMPHKGWVCVDFEDLGSMCGVCAMCETQEIRYVHYMQHDAWPELIGAGCICAEHMSDDYIGPKRREASAKNSTARRGRWLTRNWRESAKGNPHIRVDGFHIVIFPDGKRWKAVIEDTWTDHKRFSNRTFETEDKAKLAAFDAMIRFKDEWRPPGWEMPVTEEDTWETDAPEDTWELSDDS